MQHITLENFVIQNTFAFGLGIKTDFNPTDSAGSTYPNINADITVRYGKIQNTGAEGMYIGTSHVVRNSGAIEMPIIGMTVHDVETRHTGWDGMQWSNVQNLKAYNLYVSDYGYKNATYQKNGLVVGSSVSLAAPMENITINKGTGAALIVLGKGLLQFKKVRVKGVTANGESGIYMDDYASPFNLPAQQVEFDSLRVDSVAWSPIYNANRSGTAQPLKVHNYQFTAFASAVYDATKGTFVNDVVKIDTVIVKPPVDTVVVIKPPVVVDDTIRITASYTVKTSPLTQIIKFTGTVASKVTLPTTPPDGQNITIYNKGKATVSLNKRVYFTNGKYRLVIPAGAYLGFKYNKSKSKWYITIKSALKRR